MNSRQAVKAQGVPLPCSLLVPTRCDQPAVAILLIEDGHMTWRAFPRCANHPVEGYTYLVTKVYPGRRWAILPIPKAQRPARGQPQHAG